MLFPQCPRCNNRLKIGAFLVRPKDERKKNRKMSFSERSLDDFTNVPKVQCNKCMATVTINPKFYLFLTILWTIVGVIVLLGILPRTIGEISYADLLVKILLLVVSGGIITMILCWRFLEVIEDKEHDVGPE